MSTPRKLKTSSSLPPGSLASTLKERPAAETVKHLQSLLKQLKIPTRVTWYNNLGCFYSCRIVITGTDIGTNGKGVTRDLALASALGEFMERLQNRIMLFPDLIDPETVNSFPFAADPLEQNHPTDQLPPLPEDFRRYPLTDPNTNLYDFWERGRKLLAPYPRMVTYVPFYNVRTDSICYIPEFLVGVIYGSNGMCAGNSAEEAIVQGLAEILERYAGVMIYFNNLTPPTVPRSYIEEQAPEQMALIRNMEATGNYLVTIKDCSLGQGIPAVAAMIIHKPTNQYSIGFGADPCFAIALERCLTEHYQGCDIERGLGKYIPLNMVPDWTDFDSFTNFKLWQNNGIGVFPSGIFEVEPSYEFIPWPNQGMKDQKERLRYLLNWINQRDYTIFIRDASVMGVNAYYIIIPGLSEGISAENQYSPDQFYIRRMSCLSQLASGKDEDLQKAAQDMEAFLKGIKNELPVLLREYAGDKLLRPNRWRQSLHLLLTMLYYRLGQHDKALSCYQEHVRRMEKQYPGEALAAQTNRAFFYATQEFLRLQNKYTERFDKIRNMLLIAYDSEVIDQVIGFFSRLQQDFASVLSYVFGEEMPMCWNCAECGMKADCGYKTLVRVYRTLMEQIASNPIDQNNLREVFNIQP
ncbi:MAG: YcaO-like family protein [Acidobacteriota bacterium]